MPDSDNPARLTDDQGTIIDDMACCECGYNLRGLSGRGQCPECGVPIALSLDRRHRSLRLGGVRIGLWAVLGGSVVLLAALLCGAATALCLAGAIAVPATYDYMVREQGKKPSLSMILLGMATVWLCLLCLILDLGLGLECLYPAEWIARLLKLFPTA